MGPRLNRHPSIFPGASFSSIGTKACCVKTSAPRFLSFTPTADHLGGGKGWWRISTYWHTVVKSLPKRKHKKWQWKIHHEWVKMYFLLKIRIFQPVMLIFRGFWIHFPTFTVEGFFRSTSTINRTSNIQHIKRHTSHYIYNMPFCEGDNFRAIFKI